MPARGTRWLEPRGELHRKASSTAHAARCRTGTMAFGRAQRFARPLERDRATNGHGPARPYAWTWTELLDRRLGRLPGGAHTAARGAREAQDVEPARDQR